VTVATVRTNSATMTLQPSSTASALKPDAHRPSAPTRSPGFAPPACARRGVDAHGMAACSPAAPASAQRRRGRQGIACRRTDPHHPPRRPLSARPASHEARFPQPGPGRRRSSPPGPPAPPEHPHPHLADGEPGPPPRCAPPTSVHRLSTGAHKLPVSPPRPPSDHLHRYELLLPPEPPLRRRNLMMISGSEVGLSS
jgi:hypothetical protein